MLYLIVWLGVFINESAQTGSSCWDAANGMLTNTTVSGGSDGTVACQVW